MNNKIFWVCGVVLIAVVALAYGYTKSSQKTGFSNSYILPVGMENPAVTGVFLSYNFTGKIKNLQATDDAVSLTLDSSANSLPAFNVADNTKIYLVSGKDTSQGAISDLKSGIEVTIAAYYDLKTNLWATTGLYLNTDTAK